MIRFFAPGVPATKGSRRAFVHRHTGRVVSMNDNPREKAWAAIVALAAQEAMQRAGVAPLDGPVALVFDFRFARPKGHMGAKGVRPSAPPAPAVKPDWDKISRSTGDALAGICYRDDAQVVEALVTKRYAGGPGADGYGPGVLVTVRPWTATTSTEGR